MKLPCGAPAAPVVLSAGLLLEAASVVAGVFGWSLQDNGLGAATTGGDDAGASTVVVFTAISLQISSVVVMVSILVAVLVSVVLIVVAVVLVAVVLLLVVVVVVVVPEVAVVVDVVTVVVTTLKIGLDCIVDASSQVWLVGPGASLHARFGQTIKR